MSSKPFDVLEASFQSLGAGPFPLTVNGCDLGPGFPRRPVAVVELRAMLLHPSTGPAARDAALTVLVGRAQATGGAWTVSLAGVLLPGMRRAVAGLARAFPAVAEDLQADALAGLLDALGTFDPSSGRVAGRLVWQAAGRARRRLARELVAEGRKAAAAAREPHPPWGHPDFVLDEAVAFGVVSFEEAELIGETRVGGRSLVAYAAELGVADGTARMRRHRAEGRLVAWLQDRRAAEESV